jgi:hypothetical protein
MAAACTCRLTLRFTVESATPARVFIEAHTPSLSSYFPTFGTVANRSRSPRDISVMLLFPPFYTVTRRLHPSAAFAWTSSAMLQLQQLLLLMGMRRRRRCGYWTLRSLL